MSKNLERIALSSNRIIDGISQFYDTSSKKWYLETAKHLVPMYTVNKADSTLGGVFTLLAAGVEMAKIFGYAYILSKI